MTPLLKKSDQSPMLQRNVSQPVKKPQSYLLNLDEDFDFINPVKKHEHSQDLLDGGMQENYDHPPMHNTYSGFPHFNTVDQVLMKDPVPRGYPHQFQPPNFMHRDFEQRMPRNESPGRGLEGSFPHGGGNVQNPGFHEYLFMSLAAPPVQHPPFDSNVRPMHE